MRWLWVILALFAVIGGVVAAVMLTKNRGALALPEGITAFTGASVKSNNQTGSFVTGATLKLSYTSTGSGPVRWLFQRSKSPAEVIVDQTSENPYSWVVPGNVFGSVLVSVVALNNLTLSASSRPFQIVPDVIFEGLQSTTLVKPNDVLRFTYGANGTWVPRAYMSVAYASSDSQYKSFTVVPPEFVTLVDQTLSWKVQSMASGLYRVRIASTKLVSQGYDQEYSYLLPGTLSLDTEGEFNEEGKLGELSVVGTNIGPGTAVKLRLTGGDAQAHDYYYSLDGGRTFTFILENSTLVEDSWTVPAEVQGKVTVRVVKHAVPNNTTDVTLFSQVDINVGKHLLLANDTTARVVNIVYPNKQDFIISNLELVVIGVLDLDVLRDKSSWTLGWYVNPFAATREGEISAFEITTLSVVANEGVAYVSMEYKDFGGLVAPTKVPMTIEVEGVGVVTQALYNLTVI